MSIEGLNLSFSNKCPAKCVFCPPERGTSDPHFMEPDLVEKLIKEISSDDFPWKVKTIQIGENGDALTSPYFIRNIRIIRDYLPGVRINLTTNFFCMSEVQAVIILELLNGIQLNIDGHNAETYEAQKKISYNTVMKKFRMFMRFRKGLKPNFPVGVNVLPFSVYYNKVMKRFNQPPLQAPVYFPSILKSSYVQVKKSLEEKKWITEDVFIRESPSFFWAERKMDVDFNLKKHSCPQLPRIEKEAFISPSGWWYPCCFDSNQDQGYGNVVINSLVTLHNSDERLRFIKMLKNKEFKKIGYPCNRVPFCKAIK
ncbi:MAG: radical SAM/SPASM domain-containing protein [Candidatus Heimdallarchaeaceae archaeon]